jgi:hypothetical protein
MDLKMWIAPLKTMEAVLQQGLELEYTIAVMLTHHMA